MAHDLKLLDPSMGSGHFLVLALPIFVGFRMEEEGLTLQRAVQAVLRDNLFGLELDTRCTQIAAFYLALTAWRMVGGVCSLPQPNLACAGLGINAKEESWLRLGGTSRALRETLEKLYGLFRQAPLLGSLIDPKRIGGTLFAATFEQVRPLLNQALSAEPVDESAGELAVAAQGIVAAAHILAESFTLVITNVPYLGIRRQSPELREYLESAFVDSRHDLATCFLSRCLGFCVDGGTIATVSPQNWANIGSYKGFRIRTLVHQTYDFLASLGTGAFETISGEVVNVWLNIVTNEKPSEKHSIIGMDVSSANSPSEKARALVGMRLSELSQKGQLRNPDSRIILETLGSERLFSSFADCLAGVQNGDSPRFLRSFWEIPDPGGRWGFIQTAVRETITFGGMDSLIDYDINEGHLRAPAEWRREALHDSDQRGKQFWGRKGVLVSRMGNLPATLYLGDPYDQASTVIVPKDRQDLAAVWAYCSSEEYASQVRKLDKKVNVTSGTLVKVPFDASYWRSIAAENYSSGLPNPDSNDPTQWLFGGNPTQSRHPLQVAVARLVGYRWPRQTGCSFMDCPAVGPDGLESHADRDGIVCLNPAKGEVGAADRLRSLLASAYGKDWSASKQSELLSQVGYAGRKLEDWLRDNFFEQHCELFHQRPFVWHIWDGLRDGFHALVNYHKLVAPNGEGRQTLEKLIYTYLGDWIDRQRADQKNNVEGADARVAAAVHLQSELKKILAGGPLYDIFVRWKPLHEQPIGWEPDINDGVRINIRPFMTARVLNGRGKSSCLLRVSPKIKWDKDRGKEPHRAKQDFPWFWSFDESAKDFAGGNEFDGNRWNDLHYTTEFKQAARDRHAADKTRNK